MRRHPGIIGVQDPAAGYRSRRMRTMEIRRSRSTDEKSAGKIHVGGWICIISNAYHNAVAMQTAIRRTESIGALCCAVVIVQRSGLYRLGSDITYIRQGAETIQNHCI